MAPEPRVSACVSALSASLVALVGVDRDGGGGGTVAESIIARVLQDDLAVGAGLIAARMLRRPLDRNRAAREVVNVADVVAAAIIVLAPRSHRKSMSDEVGKPFARDV